MAKKTFDSNAVSALLNRGKAEARESKPAPVEPEAEAARAEKPKPPKKYLSLYLTEELCDRLYDYQLEYRKTIARKEGLHPGVSTAIERLLRERFNLQPL